MKRTIAILIALFCLMANANFSFAMREGEGENEIHLQGELKPFGRSQSNPLSASVDDANLYVDYLSPSPSSVCRLRGRIKKQAVRRFHHSLRQMAASVEDAENIVGERDNARICFTLNRIFNEKIYYNARVPAFHFWREGTNHP